MVFRYVHATAFAPLPPATTQSTCSLRSLVWGYITVASVASDVCAAVVREEKKSYVKKKSRQHGRDPFLGCVTSTHKACQFSSQNTRHEFAVIFDFRASQRRIFGLPWCFRQSAYLTSRTRDPSDQNDEPATFKVTTCFSKTDQVIIAFRPLSLGGKANNLTPL